MSSCSSHLFRGGSRQGVLGSELPAPNRTTHKIHANLSFFGLMKGEGSKG